MERSKTLVGIDGASNKTGIAVIRNNKLVYYDLLDFHQYKDTEARITLMTDAIVTVLEHFKADIIYMEDTWVSQNAKASQILTTILGGIRYWATKNKCMFNTILPSAWRKELNMNEYKAKRSELKQKSIDYVKEKFNIEVTDDVSDAICIALVGYRREKGNDS